MKEVIEIPHTQIVMSFVATFIESTARTLNTSYRDIYQRMQAVGMIEHYILPHYDVLHTESRENLVAGILEYLKIREGDVFTQSGHN